MFEGFELDEIDADGIVIRARHRLTARRPPLSWRRSSSSEPRGYCAIPSSGSSLA
jgi:hypothetical protein